jgi:hypothetical protein
VPGASQGRPCLHHRSGAEHPLQDAWPFRPGRGWDLLASSSCVLSQDQWEPGTQSALARWLLLSQELSLAFSPMGPEPSLYPTISQLEKTTLSPQSQWLHPQEVSRSQIPQYGFPEPVSISSLLGAGPLFLPHTGSFDFPIKGPMGKMTMV